MHVFTPPPRAGRLFTSRRSIRLSDMDATGRLRLDAVARYLQDVATDDVEETGWGAPEHLWVVRWYRIAVRTPFVQDREVELTTWCSALGPAAAGRRTTVIGDAGGSVEADSSWVHLDRDARPARLTGFDAYASSAEGQRTSTRLVLPEPAPEARRTPWQLRATDVDLMGHVNNAVHWAAIEDRLSGSEVELARPAEALIEYRAPIDLGDELHITDVVTPGQADVAFVAGGVTRAIARIEQSAGLAP